jgi:hypothetical protein
MGRKNGPSMTVRSRWDSLELEGVEIRRGCATCIDEVRRNQVLNGVIPHRFFDVLPFSIGRNQVSSLKVEQRFAAPSLGHVVMNTLISLIFLIAGVAFVVLGLNAMDSFASIFSRFFTGTPTDTSMWMLIAGIVLMSISGFVWFRGTRNAA